jgi:hypothetical protein
MSEACYCHLCGYPSTDPSHRRRVLVQSAIPDDDVPPRAFWCHVTCLEGAIDTARIHWKAAEQEAARGRAATGQEEEHEP